MFAQPLKQMKPSAQKKLDGFLSHGSHVLHVFEFEEARDYIVYAVAALYPEENTVRFFRVFPIMGKYQVSCDREVPLEGGTGSYPLEPSLDYRQVMRNLES